MDKTDLLDQFAQVLTTQEYTGESGIDGVKLIPLQYHRDDTGEFVELARVEGGKLKDVSEFSIAQISSSLLLPGAVKAFHLHFDQADLWYVSPYERLLVGLLDARKDSPTSNRTVRLILGGGTANLLYIPTGVAHGAANPWDKPVTLTYFTNRQFDSGSPDERRLPFDLFGKEFWELKKG